MKRKTSPKQLEALNLIAEGRFYPVLVEEDDGWHARWEPLSNPWVDEYIRSAAVTPLTEDAEDQKHETLHDAWIMALRSTTGLVRWADDECRQFAAELRDWAGAAEEDVEARRKLVFRLILPATVEGSPRLACNAPHGLREYRALGQATYVWGSLRGLKGLKDLEVELTQGEAEDFLRRGAKALRDAGYTVEGVDLAATVTAAVDLQTSQTPQTSQSFQATLTVKVAGEPVTAAEIRFLLDQGSSLVFFRDRWIEVDRNILKSALKALEKGAGGKRNLLAFAMGIGHVDKLEIDELKAHGWIRGLIGNLRDGGSAAAGAETGRIGGLEGELRDYQARGVDWLRFMTGHGFGALLADDMGLGKTIETIAWILSDVEAHTPCLVVTPLTLVSNWEHELRRFAPSLTAKDVRVVNYHRLIREYSVLSSVRWQSLIIDEAQFIKNPDTQAAKAVRALSPKNRIALTGTPIENSVEDVWALEDFLNPGFLGDRGEFRERFLRPISRNPDSAMGTKLRYALEPFVLRRLKTDPRIAAEIGEKRETREYCQLDAVRRRDYEAALADFRALEHTPGDALALLMKLKLICDGQGKLERLAELLETIFERGESALVFTQFTKVGAWIVKELDARFGRRFPYLHGALTPAAREREIERFRRGGPNAFILSLRAGGFGLNLTKATHVIHFDRWWNPAVENQATDRAHRIGQAKAVWVHLFITSGTLEERIDALLQRKETLKGLIADGEAFYNAVKLGDER